MNIEDATRIREILTMFDYDSDNLTEDQLAAIEEIEDIVYKSEYDPPKVILYTQIKEKKKWVIKHNFKSVGAVCVQYANGEPYDKYVAIKYLKNKVVLIFEENFKGMAFIIEDINNEEKRKAGC